MSDVTEWLEASGAIAGIAFGLGGLWFGYRGQQLAKRANSSAERAAESASDAVDRADEANHIAEESNRLARDANKVSERALAVASDDIDYDWTLQIDDAGMSVVRNGSAHEASDVMVVIETNGVSRTSRRFDSAAAFEELSLGSEGAFELHLERVRQHPASESYFSGQVTMFASDGPVVSTAFRAHISWTTPAGVRRTQIVEATVSHRMAVGGTIERIATT
ncbi:hypothetical protein [Gordonia malaquae]|uniref:hypothetical protein n=1 Tax=Gordonia malaquae TaxID=410332 RepID=UPI0030190B16